MRLFLIFTIIFSSIISLSPVRAHAQEHSHALNQGGTLPTPTTPALLLPSYEHVATGDRQVDAVLFRMLMRVPTFTNYRGNTHGALWEARQTPPTLRRSADCHGELTAHGVPYVNVSTLDAATIHALPQNYRRLMQRNYNHYIRHVAAPVVITGPLPVPGTSGVELVPIGPNKPALFSCTMAVELLRFAGVLRGMGFDQIGLMSAHRTHPRESFHTMGLAIDVMWLGDSTTGERLYVERDFVMTPHIRTCYEQEAHANLLRNYSAVTRRRAHQLLDLVCTVFDKQIFSTVITPNYNSGHRDHFHFDVRPYDSRVFLR